MPSCGEDDARGTKCLDRREPLDQRVLARHAPHAARQYQGGHDRQAFGSGRYGQRDGGLDHQHRIVPVKDTYGCDGRRDEERDDDQVGGKPGEVSREGRLGGGSPRRQAGDATELGAHAGRRHDADRTPAGDGRALVEHRRPVTDRHILGYGSDGLVDGNRLAGEHGFVDGQVRRSHEARIGGRHVAGLQQDDITWDQILAIDHQNVAAASDTLELDADGAQRRHGTLGLQLGEEAKQRVEDEDDKDGDRFVPVAEGGSGRCRGRQQRDHRAPELMDENCRRALGRPRIEHIAAERSLAGAHLAGIEAGIRGGRQRSEDCWCRSRMCDPEVRGVHVRRHGAGSAPGTAGFKKVSALAHVLLRDPNGRGNIDHAQRPATGGLMRIDADQGCRASGRAYAWSPRCVPRQEQND